MVSVHHAVAFAVLAATFGAAAVGAWTYYRRREARGVLTHLLALAQTLLVAQVGLGLLLLSQHHRAPHKLHYLYGRLAWFTGATLVAGALAVRAYMTGT